MRSDGREIAGLRPDESMWQMPLAQAHLRFDVSDINFRQPTPSRSMLYAFRTPGGEQITFGAEASTDECDAFAVGTECRATLFFWAPSAVDVLRPGAEFTIYYPPTRQVGRGEIDAVEV
jgi:hypothetical protein